jgi:hypothetical protein
MYETNLKINDLQNSNKMIEGGGIFDKSDKSIAIQLKNFNSTNNVIKVGTELFQKIIKELEIITKKETIAAPPPPYSKIETSEETSEEKAERERLAKKNKDEIEDIEDIERDDMSRRRRRDDDDIEEDDDTSTISYNSKKWILHKLGLIDSTTDPSKNIFYNIAFPVPESLSQNIYSTLPNGFTPDIFFSTLFKETTPININIPILKSIFPDYRTPGSRSYSTLILDIHAHGHGHDGRDGRDGRGDAGLRRAARDAIHGDGRDADPRGGSYIDLRDYLGHSFFTGIRSDSDTGTSSRYSYGYMGTGPRGGPGIRPVATHTFASGTEMDEISSGIVAAIYTELQNKEIKINTKLKTTINDKFFKENQTLQTAMTDLQGILSSLL